MLAMRSVMEPAMPMGWALVMMTARVRAHSMDPVMGSAMARQCGAAGSMANRWCAVWNRALMGMDWEREQSMDWEKVSY